MRIPALSQFSPEKTIHNKDLKFKPGDYVRLFHFSAEDHGIHFSAEDHGIVYQVANLCHYIYDEKSGDLCRFHLVTTCGQIIQQDVPLKGERFCAPWKPQVGDWVTLPEDYGPEFKGEWRIKGIENSGICHVVQQERLNIIASWVLKPVLGVSPKDKEIHSNVISGECKATSREVEKPVEPVGQDEDKKFWTKHYLDALARYPEKKDKSPVPLKTQLTQSDIKMEEDRCTLRAKVVYCEGEIKFFQDERQKMLEKLKKLG